MGPAVGRPKRALPEQALVGTAVNEAVRLSVESGSRFVEFTPAIHPRLVQPGMRFRRRRGIKPRPT